MEYIRGLPINDTPEMFGLHDNANITFAVNETYQLLNGIVKLQPKSKTGGGRSQEEVSRSAWLNMCIMYVCVARDYVWYMGSECASYLWQLYYIC